MNDISKDPFNYPAPCKCHVNVCDFGATGKVIATKGTIQAGSRVLQADNVDGWIVNAAVGITGAGSGTTPSGRPAALVTRVTAIDKVTRQLHLKDPAANTVTHAAVTADESLPIQDAVNALGKTGGTVCIPPGTYMVGTPDASTNKPIFLGSNIRVIGAGVGATVLQVCRDANVYYQHQQIWMAGPIFLNASNYWWTGTAPSAGQTGIFSGMPHDSNIEIAGISFHGDRNHQPVVYEPDYQPNPATMPNPFSSLLLNAVTSPAGKLTVGTYDIFVRFQDASGNEGGAVMRFEPCAISAPDNAINVSFPPNFPEGTVAVVPYVRRDAPSSSPSPVVEVAPSNPPGGTNPRYERLDPVPLSAIPPWNGNPDPSQWPTFEVNSHTLWPVDAVDTQGNYRVPGIVNYWGNTGASFLASFLNVDALYCHDIEIYDFVSDGFNLSNLARTIVERVHSHHNGRHGLSITGAMEEVDISDCIFAWNASSGVDTEPVSGSGLRWHNCCFLDNGFGIAIQPDTTGCRDMVFDGCLFDGNWSHVKANDAGSLIYNLKFKDCRFRNNDSNCLLIGNTSGNGEATGEITGCDFDQANGRGGTLAEVNSPTFAPRYSSYALDVPALVLQGDQTVFRITNNHFMPSAIVQTGKDGVARDFFSSAYMIDILGTAGGQTIQNNHFEINPADSRAEIQLGLGASWSRSVRNQHFLIADLQTLATNRISGNIGDGLIWTQPESGGIEVGCDLDLEERGTLLTIPAGQPSITVSFQKQLPGTYIPPVGQYLVAASFNWDAGAWWVTDANPSGFTLNWENSVPAAPFLPQISWSARFVG